MLLLKFHLTIWFIGDLSKLEVSLTYLNEIIFILLLE